MLKRNLLLLGAVLMVLGTTSAHATSQWTRKTGLACNVCQRNGYQDPTAKEGDGDTFHQKYNDELTVPKLQDMFGVRLNLTPVSYKTNAITKGADAEKAGQWTLGNQDWIQFFVAGPIFKDVSFFAEMEHTKSSFKFSWAHISLHNILGSSTANIRAGYLSAVEWSSHTNRLPIFPVLKNKAFEVKNPTADNTQDINSPRPSVDYYGYTGPFIWWAGVSPGSAATDTDTGVSYWGGLRADINDKIGGAFEGSSVTFWAEHGTEVDNVNTGATKYYNTSARNRYQAATNIRYSGLDFQGSYIWGNDADWDLTDGDADNASFWGVGVQAAWLMAGKWYPAIAFDRVVNKGAASSVNDPLLVTPALSYLVRENLRMGVYATLDLNDKEGHTKQNLYLYNIRVMF